MADMGASTPAGTSDGRTRRTVLWFYADFLELIGDAFAYWLLTIVVGGTVLGVVAVVKEWNAVAVFIVFTLLHLAALIVGFSVFGTRARKIRESLEVRTGEPDVGVL